jgi:hypothetical protein
MGDGRPEGLGVPGDRGVEITHGDGHMVDLGEQPDLCCSHTCQRIPTPT